MRDTFVSYRLDCLTRKNHDRKMSFYSAVQKGSTKDIQTLKRCPGEHRES